MAGYNSKTENQFIQALTRIRDDGEFFPQIEDKTLPALIVAITNYVIAPGHVKWQSIQDLLSLIETYEKSLPNCVRCRQSKVSASDKTLCNDCETIQAALENDKTARPELYEMFTGNEAANRVHELFAGGRGFNGLPLSDILRALAVNIDAYESILWNAAPCEQSAETVKQWIKSMIVTLDGMADAAGYLESICVT